MTGLGTYMIELGIFMTRLGTYMTGVGTDMTELGTYMTALGTYRTKLGTYLTELGTYMTVKTRWFPRLTPRRGDLVGGEGAFFDIFLSCVGNANCYSDALLLLV